MPESAAGAERQPGELGRVRAGPSRFLERPRGRGPGREGLDSDQRRPRPAPETCCASRIRPAGGSIAQRGLPPEPGSAGLGPGAGSPWASSGGTRLECAVGGRLGGRYAEGESQTPKHR